MKDIKQILVEKCDKVIEKEKVYDDFRAVIQSRHIDWKAKPSAAITSVSAKVDNVLRNFAHAHGVSGSGALKYFFETVGAKAIEHLEENYSQRCPLNDWRSYRYHIQNNKLSRKEKKIDAKVREYFDKNYGRNTPSLAA